MNSFFSSHFFKFNRLIALCVLGISVFSSAAIANPILRALQDEIVRRGISSEDVNEVMRTRFPQSAFPYYESPNGCSTDISGYRLPLRWNNAFRAACNNHDICYSTPGSSKNDCDRQFLAEMTRVCNSDSGPILCQAAASTYHYFVDRDGGEPYNTAQTNQISYIRDVYDWLSTIKVETFQTSSRINTAILIRSGDRIRIRASGEVGFGLLAGSGGPNGINYGTRYNYIAGQPHGRLMARYSRPGMRPLDGWFPVGVGWDQAREVVISEPGVLEFLVNDNNPSNNTGAFSIEVTIHSGNQ